NRTRRAVILGANCVLRGACRHRTFSLWSCTAKPLARDHVIFVLTVDQLGRNNCPGYQCRLDAHLRSLVLPGVCHCDVHDQSSLDCRRGIPWSYFVAAAGSRVKCAVPRLHEPDSAGVRRWLLPGGLLLEREENFAVSCADCAFGRPRAQKDVRTYAER